VERRLFELLFKYSRATFDRSELVFASGWPVWLLIIAIVAACALVGIVLARRRTDLSWLRTATLGVLQAALLTVLLVLLWRPALVTQTLRPQENSVAVLLDTSASMAYGDGGESRLQQAVQSLSTRALPQLKSKFNVDTFGFAGDVVELPSLEQVPAPGPVTHVGDALLSVLRGAQSGGVAAVVLVTDGDDNSGSLDAAKIAEIASYGVPVHTVGVGPESIPNDLELEDVQLPAVGLPGSTVSAQVSIRHTGAALAQLKVYDGDAIIASQAIQLPNTTGVTSRWIDIGVGEAGVRDLKFALDALPNETNTINNSRLRPMEVPAQRRHILYIEGEPRWEYKFMRRALEEGSAVRVASLLKTTPNKFYRQGVESPNELTEGFPTDAKTLFAYDALIIGSFEAAALTPEQQDMIRDFVSKRGGSLLMLGGRRGLADGGWAPTSVAEVLPATLPMLDGPSFVREPAKAQLTEVGKRSAITRLDGDEQKNVASWAELPELADFQHLGELKPGAQVLLEAQIGGRVEPLLIEQRFGQGMSYILATGGTWRWQMQLPHEDQRHETFWRQLLQALATAAPQRVTLSADHVFYGDEGTVTLRADVRDDTFEPAADAKVSVEVSDGLGPPSTIEMSAVAGQRGVYQATYETSHPGIFRFDASAVVGDEKVGNAQFAVRREDGVVEHYHVQQNRALLERLAAATGGSYFAVNDVGKLPEAVSFSDAGSVERQVLDLWNMPIVFIVLLLLKAGEWVLRLVWGRL
jgi:uncharacterized membrane protein